MSLQLFQQQTLFITSLEIAEMVKARHDNVKRAIVRLAESKVISLPPLEDVKIQGSRREETVSVYQIDKRSSYIIVAQLCPEFTAKLVDRWQELEAKLAVQFQLPQNMAEALRLAADSIERAEVAETKLLEAAPKVEFFDTVTKSNTVVTMAVAAQTAKLPFGQNILYRKLREMGVLISAGSRYNLPKQQYIEQGLFTVNEHKFERSNGEVDVNFTTHVTQKGIDWISRKMKEVA